MTDPSEFTSTPLRACFESALQAYQETTGVALIEHPLVVQLPNFHSFESITTTLKYEARALSDVLGSDRMTKLVESAATVVFALRTATLGDPIVPLYPPAKAVLDGIAILFVGAKDDNSHYDALVDLLESIEDLLKRADIYTQIHPTPTMDETMLNIVAELLRILALATKELKQGRSINVVKRGEKDVDAILQRLDRLTPDEARTTAAQILEVIHGLSQHMRMILDDGGTSLDNVRQTLEILHQMASDKNKSRRDQLQRDIQLWLFPPDPWKNHNIALGSRHSGTGTWFLQGDTLWEWKASGPSSLLWIHGKPGSGKSVLCSTIIEDINTICRSGLATLAIFYCDFRDDKKQELHGLLSSMLCQLCHQCDPYYDILSIFYSTHGNGEQSPSTSELAWCFQELLGLPRQAPVYLIIDALDECQNTSGIPSPREEVLMFVEQLIYSQLTDLRICVTSRRETDIRVSLEPLAFRSVSIHDESGQLEDIENYIRLVVNTNRVFRRWTMEHKQLVIDTLTERANGMFRWVYCQLEYLSKCLPGRIRHALDELPATLDETYERTLGGINKADSEVAHRLFQCVAVVSRPLRVEEIAELLAFDFKARPIPNFREDWRPENPVEAVLSKGSTFLALANVGGSTVIQFSHFSIKEFLTSARFAEKQDAISRRYHISTTSAHTLVAQACLGILLHLDEKITRLSLPRFPLVQYAAEHWFEHARFEGVSQNVEEGMMQFFDPKTLHLAIWVWISDQDRSQKRRYRRSERLLPNPGTPLRYASLCGLHSIVPFLVVEHSQEVDSRDADESTPLHLASRKGHVEVARALILHGADVSAKDKYGSTALHWASRGHHVGFALFLIEHGADVSAKNKDGSIALHWASARGHMWLSRLLVEHGADVSASDKDGWTPLHWASGGGHVDLAQLLIEHGADASANDKYGSTPLHWASGRGHVDLARFLVEHGTDLSAKDEGHVDLARLLIKHGADASAGDKDGWTPLHWASGWGHVDLARLLIEHGADMLAKDEQGSTPLDLALRQGHVNLARFLIEHGADVSAKDKDGSIVLHLASARGHVELSQLLVEHGADVSARDMDGWTPLHWASGGGHVDLARLLIEHGADASVNDKYGSTPLHWASGRGQVDLARFPVEHGTDLSAKDEGHVDLARLLIEHGADASAGDKDGWTPLHWASGWGHVDLARLLIEHGADMLAKDEQGSTPLDLALRQGHVNLARFLVEHGAGVSTKDKYGSTPLHWTLRQGHVDLARFLVEHGADLSAKDKHGSTPLHLASRRGHVDLARLLLEYGADIVAKDEDGSTALHWALRRGHIDLARILVEHDADVSAKDEQGSTPLHLVSRRGHVDLARFLVEHGVDVSAKDKYGSTPLHWALRWNHVDVARFLVEHGADLEAKDKQRSTPLHLALREGHVDLAKFLREHGAIATPQSTLRIQQPTCTIT